MLKIHIIGWLSRFARDRRGVSAVEFAFIAPVMIGLYFGCAEISDGVAADRKVSLIAGALANLTAQSHRPSARPEMTNILDASSAIIAPYPASLLKMTVSCLKIDATTGVATVKWSETRNGTARAIGSVYSFPGTATALAVKSSWLLFARGDLRLHTDSRLHHHRHAHAVGSYVHEPAYYRADLRRHDLHLTAAAMPAGLRRSAAPWSI